MRTRAIILKKQNTNEYDQLVSCYTEELGKVTAIAKSVLKPNSIQAMHLDLFNLVDFDLINGRAIPIITGAQAEQTYANLKSDLSRLATAYFFAEVMDKLAFDYQKDDELWAFLLNLMEDLNIPLGKASGNKEFLRLKQIEFLNILGYAPNLTDCAFCSAPTGKNIIAYSVELRGAICQNCFLNGQRGIVLKPASPAGGGKNIFGNEMIGAIFEGLSEKKLASLNLLRNVVK